MSFDSNIQNGFFRTFAGSLRISGQADTTQNAETDSVNIRQSIME